MFETGENGGEAVFEDFLETKGEEFDDFLLSDGDCLSSEGGPVTVAVLRSLSAGDDRGVASLVEYDLTFLPVASLCVRILQSRL